MFTGIVEEVGIVRELGSNHLGVEAHGVLDQAKLGDSMAVNGVCLTVTSLGDHGFAVDVMPETLRRTNLGALRYGDRVNIERPLVFGGRVGGHLVQGHVDDIGEVVKVTPEGVAQIMKVSAPPGLLCYVVDKGFIAVDGVSLTVAGIDESAFQVSLVAYTMEHTTLGLRRPGSKVNLEADIVGKYVEGLCRRKERGLTVDLLRDYGYVEGNA